VPKTWLSIRVDPLSGAHTGDLWPTPGRVLVVGPQHTFADLATAIDDAFARWDRSHLFEFTLPGGRRVGLPDDEWDDEPVLDAALVKVGRSAALGTEFRYVFDLGDFWVHRCTVAARKIDPVDALGIVPDRPLPCFGWGTIPDQYGRSWDGDDGERRPPPRLVEPDPMMSPAWPQVPSSGARRLGGDDLRALRGAAVGADREAVRELLAGTDPTLLLQHAGTALLAVGVGGLEDVVRDVVGRLTARGDDGDDVLALALTARLGGPQPLLRPVRTDLEQVADLLAGDPVHGQGGYVDLTTGEVWPQVALENLDEDERPDLDDPDRWLYIHNESSHDRWNDRHEFAERLRPGPLRDGLLDALEGRGAFGRFARALDREPALLAEWRAFSAEREVGRARATLAAFGYLALPS
jgi:hypothetical protein